jgi:dTMP kinase
MEVKVSNKLIFVEGPKGVGKSRALSGMSSPYHHLFALDYTREPWNRDIAELASDVNEYEADPTTQAMLFTADRRIHMRYVQDWLEKNAVICDRGPLSTMVYQGLVGGVDLDWLLDLNGVAMEGVEVAATILLHAPFDITVQRIEGRGTPLTQQERDELRPAWEAYESLRLGAHDANGHLKHFVSKWKDLTGWIHYIDANRQAAEVEADVLATIDRIIQGA